MSETFTYRPYQPGDELAINELYFNITGRQRTSAQFSWQWLEAPAGRGDMWLIEAIDDYGRVKLIGHHGVMPIAFSYGDTDLVFGKTENTMVLPEYRKKILYPRYEKKFAKAYGSRYDALFSTMGPPAAIRQRKAMGYQFPVEWHAGRCSLSLSSDLLFIASLLEDKLIANRNIELPFGKQTDCYKNLLKRGFLSSEDAVSSKFFDGFWDKARQNFSVAPSRRKQDLAWRFWGNPYKDHLTLIVNEQSVKGYCIVSFVPRHCKEVLLEDFCVHSNTACEAEFVFDKLLHLLRMSGIYSLSVVSTTDSSLFSYGFLDKKSMLMSRLIKRKHERTVKLMPRKITDKGKIKKIHNIDWDITGIVLEGRL